MRVWLVLLFSILCVFPRVSKSLASEVEYSRFDSARGCLEALGGATPDLPFRALGTPFFSGADLARMDLMFERFWSWDDPDYHWTSENGVNFALAEARFQMNSDGVFGFEWIDDLPSFVPRRVLKRSLQSAVEKLRYRLPSAREFFSRMEGETLYAYFLVFGYVLSAGEVSPGYGWHHDGSLFQVSIPVWIPRNLEGGRFLVRRNRPLRPDTPIAAIRPRRNRPILLDSQRMTSSGDQRVSWHGVEGFRWRRVSVDEQTVRNFFFVGVSSQPQSYLDSARMRKDPTEVLFSEGWYDDFSDVR